MPKKSSAPKTVAVKKVLRALNSTGLSPEVKAAIIEEVTRRRGGKKAESHYRIKRATKKKLEAILNSEGLAGLWISKNGKLHVLHARHLQLNRKFNFDNEAILNKAIAAVKKQDTGATAQAVAQ